MPAKKNPPTFAEQMASAVLVSAAVGTGDGESHPVEFGGETFETMGKVPAKVLALASESEVAAITNAQRAWRSRILDRATKDPAKYGLTADEAAVIAKLIFGREANQG